MAVVVQMISGPSPLEAFTVAQTDARYLFGNSGRTGTIAEADGFEVVSDVPLLEWSAQHEARGLAHRGRVVEGGPVLLVPVGVPLRRKNVGVSVDVVGLEAWERECRINDAVMAEAGSGQSIVELVARDHTADDMGRKGKLRTKALVPAATQNAGRKQLFHVYVQQGGGPDARMQTFERVNDARAWAKDYVKRSAEVCRVSVRGEVSRGDGGPLWSGGRVPVVESVFVRAQIALCREAVPTRWVAVGSYRS